MDIVFLAITVIAALVLSRERALAVTAAAWAVCLAMVGWGPAHNSDVHTDSLGFWGPWLVVLVIAVALVFGINAFQRRREANAGA